MVQPKSPCSVGAWPLPLHCHYQLPQAMVTRIQELPLKDHFKLCAGEDLKKGVEKSNIMDCRGQVPLLGVARKVAFLLRAHNTV